MKYSIYELTGSKDSYTLIITLMSLAFLYFPFRAAFQGLKAPKGKKSERFVMSVFLFLVVFVFYGVAPNAVEAFFEYLHK